MRAALFRIELRIATDHCVDCWLMRVELRVVVLQDVIWVVRKLNGLGFN